jgi:hypothetical protein
MCLDCGSFTGLSHPQEAFGVTTVACDRCSHWFTEKGPALDDSGVGIHVRRPAIETCGTRLGGVTKDGGAKGAATRCRLPTGHDGDHSPKLGKLRKRKPKVDQAEMFGQIRVDFFLLILGAAITLLTLSYIVVLNFAAALS